MHFQTCAHEDSFYQCVVPHVNFYAWIMVLVLALVCLYILANVYTLLWIAIKWLRPMSKLLHQYNKYQEIIDEPENRPKKFGGKLSLDVQYLLDLIAEKLGIDVALKILTVIDPDFGPLWNIRVDKNLQITAADSIQVTVAEPKIVNYFDENYLKKFMYVINLSNDFQMRQEAFVHDQCALRRSSGFDRVQFYQARFSDLHPGSTYTLQASTYFNGKEVIRHDLEDVATRPCPPAEAKGQWSALPEDGQIYFNYCIQWPHTTNHTYQIGKQSKYI